MVSAACANAAVLNISIPRMAISSVNKTLKIVIGVTSMKKSIFLKPPKLTSILIRDLAKIKINNKKYTTRITIVLLVKRNHKEL